MVFGFFYLVLTASLGPFMILKHYDDVGASEAAKQQKVGALQQARDSGYEVDLEKMNAEQIAKAATDALLALSARLNSRAPIEEIKGGPHSHGNLEAVSRSARPFRAAVPGRCHAAAVGHGPARELGRLCRAKLYFGWLAAHRYRGGDGLQRQPGERQLNHILLSVSD